jgi:hypothetical protein
LSYFWFRPCLDQPSEATEVQAINDFVLFTIAGAGSLASGFIFAEFGAHLAVL